MGAPSNDVGRDENDAVNIAFSETHVFGAAVVHEARIGFNSLRTNKRPVSPGFPNQDVGLHVDAAEPIEGLARLTFGGTYNYVPLGEAQFTPTDKTAGTFQVLENLSITKGAHSLKIGADLRRIKSDIVAAQQARGLFNFNGRFTGSSLGDFLLGMTSSRQLSTVQRANLRERDYMFYVQDDWRAASRLTVNLGLRYELASPMFDTLDRLTSLQRSAFPEVRVLQAGERGRSWSERALVQTDRNNWAPRLGLAYQPAPLWTVRAAGGLFYGMPKGLGPNVHLVNNWPFSREVTVQSTATRAAGQLSDGIDRDLLGTTTLMPPNLSWSVWSEDFVLPTIVQWNVNVQRQVARSWAATVAYVGSSSQHLQRTYNINAADPGDGSTERERRMIPALGAILLTESSGLGSYRGLETTIAKRLSRGTQASVAYTWSHSVDDVNEALGSEGSIIQDRRNLAADRGNSAFDRRHRVVGSALVELPLGAGKRWLANGSLLGRLFSDWQLSGIAALQSGAYFDVAIVDPTNRLGVTPGSSVWRPDLSGQPGLPHPTADAWLNDAAFVIPQNPDGTYRYGTLGRNSLEGPGYFNIDASLSKEVRLGRTRRLQIRWEVFNVTNHPSYGLPNANLGSVDFGAIRTTVSTPRQMQFGLKLIF